MLAQLLTSFLVASSLSQALVFDINFDAGEQAFNASFADYPHGAEAFYALRSGLRPLPMPDGAAHQGYMLSGNNHSDDLLMVLYGSVTNLAAGAHYHASLCVEFMTQAPYGMIGVGGSPAESVWVKLGVLNHAPHISTDAGSYQRVSEDFGAQSQGGRDAQVVGDIGVEPDAQDNSRWELKRLCTGDTLVHVVSNDGTLWPFVAFDSGFEATTTVYVTRLTLTVQ